MSAAAPELTRPEEILRAFDARHPGIWEFFARCRRDRNWPDWCYVPVEAAHAFIGREMGLAGGEAILRESLRRGDPALLAAGYDAGIASTMAAWRMGRGIYIYDADFAAALAGTSLAGEIPVDVLLHLPEWAVYVELDRPPARGFFAALDWSPGRGHAEMRLLFDVGDPAPMLLPLPLTASTIEGMLEAMWTRMRANTERMNLPADPGRDEYMSGDMGRIIRDALPAAVNLLLYLCSPEAEYNGGVRPERPVVIKTRRGERMFPVATPRVWRIGEAIGARLRAASADRDLPEERNAPRPHLRRAHWHTYRVGKGRAGFRPRWLHPILVGYREGEPDDQS